MGDSPQFDTFPPKLLIVELTNVHSEDSIGEAFDRLSRHGYTLHYINLDETLDPLGLPAGSIGNHGFSRALKNRTVRTCLRGNRVWISQSGGIWPIWNSRAN